MKKSRFVLATFLAGSLAVFADVAMTKIGEYNISVDGCGGITYAGGNNYYVVRDHNDNNVAVLYPLTINTNPSTGAITSQTFGDPIELSGGKDAEGIAYDPATGRVWVSDETTPTISEHQPSTGAKNRSLTLPDIQRTKKRSNKSLEALSMSGDGLTLWTCNEEALTCDGNASSDSVRTVVRLTRYTRPDVSSDFMLSGQWPYACETSKYSMSSSYQQTGAAGLCALPDGSLLVLEREVSTTTWGRCEVYRVTPSALSAATDVSFITALTNVTYSAVAKGSALVSFTGGGMSSIIVYEGICLGPRLSDGSLAVYLISDGGATKTISIFTATTVSRLCALKLTGLDVHTLDFAEPARGTSSITGSNYRYLNGATVNVSLAGGVQTPPTAYTNNAAALTDVGWSASGQSPASGGGETASFAVAADGTFAWTFADSVAATPIIGGDSFEPYAVGTDASGLAGWSGDGVVESGTPTRPTVGYPMPNEAHEKVLTVDGEVTRTYSGTTNGNQRLEMMLSVRRSPNDELAVPEGDNQVVIAADKDGYLNIYRRTATNTCEWARLSETQYANGQWVRVGLYMDYDKAEGASVLVKLDGVECGWHLMPNGGASRKVSSFTVSGATKVDDVLLTMTHFTNDWPVIIVDTVPPAAWFDRYGITGDSRVPGAYAVNGYTMLEAYTAGLDPTANELFRITDIKILPDDRLQLTLNSVRDDLSSEELTSLFAIVRSTTLGGEETTVPGTAVAGEGCTIWTSTGAVAGDKAFYRVKVIVPGR